MSKSKVDYVRIYETVDALDIFQRRRELREARERANLVKRFPPGYTIQGGKIVERGQ